MSSQPPTPPPVPPPPPLLPPRPPSVHIRTSVPRVLPPRRRVPWLGIFAVLAIVSAASIVVAIVLSTRYDPVVTWLDENVADYEITRRWPAEDYSQCMTVGKYILLSYYAGNMDRATFFVACQNVHSWEKAQGGGEVVRAKVKMLGVVRDIVFLIRDGEVVDTFSATLIRFPGEFIADWNARV